MNHLKKNICRLAILIAGSCWLAPFNIQAQYVGPEAGQKVAFMGDSITAMGEAPTGYVSLVAMALERQGKKIVVIPAGVSGNTSQDMLVRLDRDVLSKKPDWLMLSCGVNDVWHGPTGVPIGQYRQNMMSIVDQALEAGIKVVLLTSTMIGEDQANSNNQKLITYNNYLQSLAVDKHLLIADLNAGMQAALAEQKTASPNLKGNVLTIDGVHMNGPGNEMMAAGVLKALGFTDAQLAKEKELWQDLPGGSTLNATTAITVRQYLKLRAMAASQGLTVEDFLNDELARDVQNRLSAAPPNAPAKP